MLEKILRLAQNDKEETETPQAFPSEMILPPIGKDEVYQAFPSEGKGDRRTAVDEVKSEGYIALMISRDNENVRNHHIEITL